VPKVIYVFPLQGFNPEGGIYDFSVVEKLGQDETPPASSNLGTPEQASKNPIPRALAAANFLNSDMKTKLMVGYYRTSSSFLLPFLGFSDNFINTQCVL
jgi:hypothetical protein